MARFDIPKEKVREMQLVGLKILRHFDAVCKENELTYFFCGGCCIGTIRNKGFVPWDDDVDVFMPRKDYEKLKKVWVNSEDYSIQYTTKDYITENQFLTICDNNTTFIKTYQKDLDINHGVVLDVIPLDGCPKGCKRKMQKIWALLYSLFIIGKAPENHGKFVRYTAKIILGFVPDRRIRYKIWSYCERKMTQYPIEKCDYITELCTGPHYMKNEYPKEIFDHAVYKEFENELFPVPAGYDQYLRMAFGDYMELPPVEKRVCHHAYEYMDMKNSYRNYKGIYYCTGPSK